MIIVRLLSPEPVGWLALPTLLGRGSRHCHGINYTTDPSHYFDRGGMNSASDVARRLLHDAHVVVVPGEGFGTQDHVRISYATSEQSLALGVERMKEFFAKV